MRLRDGIREADWKKEKHVPVIEGPERVDADTTFDVSVSVGKEIPHPNTTEHHIRWISLYFQPEGSQVLYQVGHVEFSAPQATFSMKTNKSGTLHALALCNIHGLWEGSRAIQVG
ncbi:MAG: class II SORL domain-containing protein [Anaerolineae bacterium]|nr:class II SORL domain-containing protein [Anaerolineae bacterium]